MADLRARTSGLASKLSGCGGGGRMPVWSGWECVKGGGRRENVEEEEEEDWVTPVPAPAMAALGRRVAERVGVRGETGGRLGDGERERMGLLVDMVRAGMVM